MIHVLTGTNGFMLQQRKRALIDDFIAAHGSMAVEQLDGEEVSVDRIREAIESIPFLATRKLVVLLKPGLNKDFFDAHKELLLDVTETTDIIIVEPKFDKRSGYYKFVKKLDGFEEFTELDPGQLVKWAQEYVKKWDVTIDTAAIRELVNRTGGEQLRLQNELDKLSMHADKIDRSHVELLTASAPSSTIFELLDAVFSGNKNRAMELYKEQRTLNVDPMQIIAMLAWQFHVLAIVKAAGNKSSREIASEAKLNPFVVQKTQSVARHLSLQRIKELVHELRILDERLKRTRINSDDALQAYLLSI